ncbi:MAG TPA: PqqD family protein [Desulfotomaculum sp.]|nr:MAG: hypothetical protein JL56_07885 [Desulfotomaculum sp. BICA1-6]HBX23301.1 PqqD family protein [Desulfotomaculum sp.]
MLEIENTTIFKLNSNYSLSALGSENAKFWLFELKEGNIYKLNDVSYSILSLLDGRTSFGSLIETVASQYDGVTKEEIVRDGKDFFTRCLNNGIIYLIKGD